MVISEAPCNANSGILQSPMVRKVFPGSMYLWRTLHLPHGFLFTSHHPSTPDGALKSSHCLSTPSVYSKRIAPRSKDWVQHFMLNYTEHKAEVLFQKAGT